MKRVFLLFYAVTALAADPTLLRPVVTDTRPLVLQTVGALDRQAVPECSALLLSPTQERVVWALSDSEGPVRLVPIRPSGLIAQPVAKADGAAAVVPKYLGTEITGVKNLDWEALASDGAGNLIIGDVGNNLSRRRELVLYFVPEPLLGAATATPTRRLSFTWPDQVDFPDPDQRHDCEAMFWYRGKLHLLTKHRRDTESVLWRVEIPAVSTKAYLSRVGAFDAHGMVTDASVSPNGKFLAVLTYRMLWIFNISKAPENPLTGQAWARPIQLPVSQWQVEGCAWLDNESLLLGSEEGGLFRVKLDDLTGPR